MARLDHKVVIVTGAAQGTGAGIARRAVAEGARVLLGDVQEEAGQRAAAALGSAARFVRLDVTSERDWQAVVAECGRAFGRLDGLVNNAAVLHMGSLEQTPLETMERLLRVNLIGAMLGVKCATAALRAAGGGSIVNVGSTDGLGGMNSVAAYSASKWGLRGLTRSAAIELGRDGIRVNCVCPSSGNPEMHAPWQARVDVKRYLRHVPPPVLFADGKPAPVEIDDIAALVCFLLADESRRITGTDLAIDAGWTAGKHCPGLPDF